MNEDTKCELIKLAAEMVRCDGMPSEYRDDYPNLGWKHIKHRAEIANQRAKDWAFRLRQIIDREGRS